MARDVIGGLIRREPGVDLIALIAMVSALLLGEYLAALKGRASARQAQRDLAAAPFLERRGRTRSARWVLAPASSGVPRSRAAAGRPGAPGPGVR